MKNIALLLRLNPKDWPVWNDRLKKDSYHKVWFRTGRRNPSEIRKGVPVYVLATDGLGLVAHGKTVSNVEKIVDPDWRESAPEYYEKYKLAENRVCTELKRISVPLLKINFHKSLRDLYRRRETTTWLTKEQADLLSELIKQSS